MCCGCVWCGMASDRLTVGGRRREDGDRGGRPAAAGIDQQESSEGVGRTATTAAAVAGDDDGIRSGRLSFTSDSSPSLTLTHTESESVAPLAFSRYKETVRQLLVAANQRPRLALPCSLALPRMLFLLLLPLLLLVLVLVYMHPFVCRRRQPQRRRLRRSERAIGNETRGKQQEQRRRQRQLANRDPWKPGRESTRRHPLTSTQSSALARPQALPSAPRAPVCPAAARSLGARSDPPSTLDASILGPMSQAEEKKQSSAETEWVLDSLVGFLKGPLWHEPLFAFLDEMSVSEYLLLDSCSRVAD